MTHFIVPDPLSQIHADTTLIVNEIERLTGLHSRWSGRVVIGTDLNAVGRAVYFGAKAWNCDIVLHQERVSHSGKYSTLIHEAFHSVSVGLNEQDFQFAKGWEEGVVESCTRLYRNALLSASRLSPTIDVRTSYARYLTCLEDLRIATVQNEPDFYLTLLATQLDQREKTVLQWIQQNQSIKTVMQIMLDTDAQRQELKR